MEKEFQKKKPEQEKKDRALNTILFSSLAITFLLLVELFLIITMPHLLPVIAVVAVVIVGCTYLDLSSCIMRLRQKEQEQEEQYASILKSEKAAYLLIRKYFDEIEEQLTLMEDRLSSPFQEVVVAQKATAKATISRNKENTDAIMNSNDKMVDLIIGLDDKMQKLSDEFSLKLNEDGEDKNEVLLQKQAEVSNQMRELELSLKNEILQAVNRLSSVSPQVVMAAPQMMPVQPPVSAPINQELEPEPSMDLPDFEGLGGLGDLPDFVPMDAVEPETTEPIQEEVSLPEVEEVEEEIVQPVEPIEPVEPVVEAEPVAEELPPMPDLSDPNRQMSPDDIAALLANMSSDTADAAPVSNAEEVQEEVVEPLVEEEPVAEELPPLPDLSDPNKMMSPDDISALLASMSADVADAASLPDVENVEEPQPAPEPVAEELPPMPDLSDPNRQMSPDEIAALFANM